MWVQTHGIVRGKCDKGQNGSLCAGILHKRGYSDHLQESDPIVATRQLIYVGKLESCCYGYDHFVRHERANWLL